MSLLPNVLQSRSLRVSLHCLSSRSTAHPLASNAASAPGIHIQDVEGINSAVQSTRATLVDVAWFLHQHQCGHGGANLVWSIGSYMSPLRKSLRCIRRHTAVCMVPLPGERPAAGLTNISNMDSSSVGTGPG